MKIAYVRCYGFSEKTWRKAAKALAPSGLTLRLFMQRPGAAEAVREFAPDMVIADLSASLPEYAAIREQIQTALHRIAVGMEADPAFSTFSEEEAAAFQRYIEHLSAKNYEQGVRFLGHCAGSDISYEPVQAVRTYGIYHPESEKTFTDLSQYLEWSQSRGRSPQNNAAGVLCYYGQIVEDNKDDIDAVIPELEKQGLFPVCVYCEGPGDGALPEKDRYPWLDYFQDEKAPVQVILNLLAGRLLSKAEDYPVLSRLNVPVMQLLRNHQRTPKEWLNDPEGMPSFSIGYGLAQPEMAGAIEPIMVAGADATAPDADPHGGRKYIPIPERVEAACKRAARWTVLRNKSNQDKKLTIVLHNAPCKGVEATVGVAVGLDVFESLAAVIKELKAAGYDVGDCPETGQEILDAIMEKKAISEFRWTTVDEIVNKGGALYMMDQWDYGAWFDILPDSIRKRVNEAWDRFPGEGMVYDGQIVITGLEYGNLKIMLQPKRGCYGAKCNGEVCRILHDPEIPPPHNFLATYHFIERTSDAVIHFGTEGALEYLPGKRAAMSHLCYSDICLNQIPNAYVYSMDVTGEGIIAKRRARAVLVDHLTPPYLPAPLGDKMRDLEDLLVQYQKAEASRDEARRARLEKDMTPLMDSLGMLNKNGSNGFKKALPLVSRHIQRARETLMPNGMHVLGRNPNEEDTALYLDSIRQGGKGAVFDEPHTAALLAQSHRELEYLLKTLNGEYVEPGLSASLLKGKTEALPTGRNFFATDVEAVPTAAAWEVGKELADGLLLKYYEEEGSFCENVGVSLWSSDAFKCDGEVFAQILYLMGVMPKWSYSGRLEGLAVLSLESLVLELSNGKTIPRPRVDVTIQTSGIVRDLVPNFCKWTDKAVQMAAALDEPLERNFIRKHVQEEMEEMSQSLDEALDDSAMFRKATFRVFSSAPGTYGIGVGLAVDASAWTDEKDLAEAYINWGGHAYGDLQGSRAAHNMLAKRLKSLDVAYMRQFSREYDLLDCGCYASFQGGMAASARGLGGKQPKTLWADDGFSGKAQVVDFKEELERSARAKLFNRHWIDAMKRHGYKGASSVSGRVNNLFRWSATSGEVGSWMFDSVVDTYINNPENAAWLKENNPYAMEEITRRLLEAHSRGLWDADEDRLNAVREQALEIEGDMEEIMGDVEGEFQGGEVTVMTADDVEKWDYAWKLTSR
ncbi:cobaltochelatase subunit CobN [Desulfatibacillum aliphaticivorans]|uniref:cobaltochelatase subunit CobN n=1 Tax=Desulfatibacillum aliphaticivorans TaxID=218208 RepID=UPI00040F04CF|nr:cobaltochelatase subunit CobN [Desulfatibacillum aliphaticivorans]